MAENVIEHWGAVFKGYPDYSAKMYPAKFSEAIWKLVDNADLKAECQFSASFPKSIKAESNVLSDEQAEAVASILYRAFHNHFFNRAGHNGVKIGLPSVAAAVVFAAIEFLEEAFENGRTLIAYRNRHNDFLKALAQLGEEIYGERQYHDNFYAHLGRRLSQVVMGEGLIDGSREFVASSREYQAVEQAVAEQLVYFVGCGKDGPVKIGIAAKPHERLSSLQTGHHEQLHLLAVTTGGREAELAYHEQFRDHHARGEWFTRHPDILAEIARLGASHD